MKWKTILIGATLFFVACSQGLGQLPSAEGVTSPTYQPIVTGLSTFPPFTAEPAVPATPATTPVSTATPAPKRTATTGPLVLRGVASYGPFSGHIVTRYKRGTLVRATGPNGRSDIVKSWGYGPDPKIFPERIADLDTSWFRVVCGPTSMGLCNITLEVWN